MSDEKETYDHPAVMLVLELFLSLWKHKGFSVLWGFFLFSFINLKGQSSEPEMNICKKKLAIKDTGKRFGFLLFPHLLVFCSLPIPNQLRSGGSMSGISFKDTQTSRVGFGTARRPCSMRVQFSEAL